MRFSSIRHNRQFGYFIVIAIVAAVTSLLCFSLNTTEFRRSLNGVPNKKLMERGREYYRQRHMDSALMVFSYIGDTFDQKMDIPEKRLALLAKNNVGIIYSFQYMDFPRGFETLKTAYDQADEPGLEDTQAVICHNIVSLLVLHSMCLKSDNVKERIDEYRSIGLKKAFAGKNYPCLASLVINAVYDDLSFPVSSLSVIESKEIPDTIEGIKYARALLCAARAYQNGQLDSTISMLSSATALLPEFYSASQYAEAHLRTLAGVYKKKKDYVMAEQYALKSLHEADSLQDYNSQIQALTFLSALPGKSQDKYSARLIQVKDSALTQGRLQMVSEIEFLNSLAKERAENQRLAEQRQRLFWGLGVGGFLLMVFGLLITLLVRNSRKLKERNASLYAKIQEQLASPQLPSEKDVKPVDEGTAEADADQLKYAGSSLSEEKMDDLHGQLFELLRDENWVIDPEVSLAKTAGHLNVNTAYISRVVNQRFGKSFSALVNEHRVRIATRRMQPDSPYANQTIESIAQSVGYSSRSSFITAFKKINGMTPSEYLKLSRRMNG